MIFPVMITLQEIRGHSPCRSGWAKVLDANGGVNADMSKQFELSSIIDSNSVADCIWSLRCKPEYSSLWRKLAVVFADEVKHLMTDERSIKALDVAWLHSEYRVSDEELSAAAYAADAAAYAADAAAYAAYAAAYAAYAAAAADAAAAAAYAACAAYAAADAAAAYAALQKQAEILHKALTTGIVERTK